MMDSQKSRWLIYANVAAALLLAVLLCVFGYRISTTLQHVGIYDFGIFFEKCRHFIVSGQLYDRDLALYAPLEPVYKFPPLSAAVMVQIEQAGVTATALAQFGGWMELSLFILPTLLLVNALLPEKKRVAMLVGGFIVATAGPTLEENLTRLQLEPVLFACCALSLLALLKQKDFLAGMLVGLAVCLKLYPAVMVLYFLVTRRWSALVGMIAIATLSTAYSLAVLGLSEHLFFVKDLLPVLLREYPITEPENVSLAAWARLYGMEPAAAKSMTQFFLLVTCGLATLLALQEKNPVMKTPADSRRLACGFSAFLLAMLIGMPNPLWNYQILLVIPLVVIVSLAVRDVIEKQQWPGVWIPLGVLCVFVSLYVGAVSTVDEIYYPATLVQKVMISASRSLAPFVLFVVLFLVLGKATSSSSVYRPCPTGDV